MERHKYRNILRTSKTKTLRNKANECDHNIKKIYRLVNNLTGKSTENSLPNFIKNKEELATNFADYFMDKIHKIHDNLQHHDKDKPTKLKITPLTKCDEMNVDVVTQIIQLMATKSCELDPIPAMVLKKFLKDLTPKNY